MMGGKQALCFLYDRYRSKAMSGFGLFLLRTPSCQTSTVLQLSVIIPFNNLSLF
jgi:hypothetical protein